MDRPIFLPYPCIDCSSFFIDLKNPCPMKQVSAACSTKSTFSAVSEIHSLIFTIEIIAMIVTHRNPRDSGLFYNCSEKTRVDWPRSNIAANTIERIFVIKCYILWEGNMEEHYTSAFSWIGFADFGVLFSEPSNLIWIYTTKTLLSQAIFIAGVQDPNSEFNCFRILAPVYR